MAESQVPAGAVVAHTMWGEPKGDTRHAHVGDGAAPSPPGGMAYINPRDKHCRANNDTCMGWAAKGEQYCPGHLKAIENGTYRPEDW